MQTRPLGNFEQLPNWALKALVYIIYAIIAITAGIIFICLIRDGNGFNPRILTWPIVWLAILFGLTLKLKAVLKLKATHGFAERIAFIKEMKGASKRMLNRAINNNNEFKIIPTPKMRETESLSQLFAKESMSVISGNLLGTFYIRNDKVTSVTIHVIC